MKQPIASAEGRAFLHPNPKRVSLCLRPTADLRSSEQQRRYEEITLPKLMRKGARG